MNGFKVRNLVEGEQIIFKEKPLAFTDGKSYEVIKTSVGSMVVDDNGNRHFLWDNELYRMFEKVE